MFFLLCAYYKHLYNRCIPYRLVKTKDQHVDKEKRIEVLMVSSPNRNDMVFPKVLNLFFSSSCSDFDIK